MFNGTPVKCSQIGAETLRRWQRSESCWSLEWVLVHAATILNFIDQRGMSEAKKSG